MNRAISLMTVPALFTFITNGRLEAQFSLAMTGTEPTSTEVLASGGVQILDEYLRARIEELEKQSTRFHAAMERTRQGRIPVIIGSPAQVRDRLAARLAMPDQLGGQRVGEFVVLRMKADTAKIDVIAIRVDVELVRRGAFWRAVFGAATQRRWLDVKIDAILIHEIWGHLAPVIEAGNLTGNCPDPRVDESAGSSCVMQRENDLRTELGLKPRRSYAISVD